MLKGGDILRRIVFEDTFHVAAKMIERINDGADLVSAVCFYELATAITEELIREGCHIDYMDLKNIGWDGYDREYCVSLSQDHEGNLFVSAEKIYNTKKDVYVGSYSDVIYVHQDCNSKVLSKLDAEEMYEFSVGWVDDEEDDEDSVPGVYEYTHVSRAVDGSPTGFSKSWYGTDDTGKSSYASYSFISDNKNLLEKIAESWNIKL